MMIVGVSPYVIYLYNYILLVYFVNKIDQLYEDEEVAIIIKNWELMAVEAVKNPNLNINRIVLNIIKYNFYLIAAIILLAT